MAGLTPEMYGQVKESGDLDCIIGLYDAMEKVKKKHRDNSEQIDQLKQLFGKLSENINNVLKETKDSRRDESAANTTKKGTNAASKDKN